MLPGSQKGKEAPRSSQTLEEKAARGLEMMHSLPAGSRPRLSVRHPGCLLSQLPIQSKTRRKKRMRLCGKDSHLHVCVHDVQGHRGRANFCHKQDKPFLMLSTACRAHNSQKPGTTPMPTHRRMDDPMPSPAWSAAGQGTRAGCCCAQKHGRKARKWR